MGYQTELREWVISPGLGINRQKILWHLQVTPPPQPDTPLLDRHVQSPSGFRSSEALSGMCRSEAKEACASEEGFWAARCRQDRRVGREKKSGGYLGCQSREKRNWKCTQAFKVRFLPASIISPRAGPAVLAYYWFHA